jgi:hypothetical protein
MIDCRRYVEEDTRERASGILKVSLADARFGIVSELGADRGYDFTCFLDISRTPFGLSFQKSSFEKHALNYRRLRIASANRQ